MSESEVPSLLRQLLTDILSIFPKAGVATLIIFVTLLIAKLLNKAINWLVRVSRIEDYIKRAVPEGTRIPVNSLLVFIADAGVIATGMAVIVRVFVPEYTQAYKDLVTYIYRVGSVVILSILTFVIVDAFVKSMRLERKTERFFTMLSLLLITLLLVDLAALSSEIKLALAIGIAIGIGLLIGVFSVWAFFGEQLDLLLRAAGKSAVGEARDLTETSED
jgi:multidrug transporter EmrE-like cation transporter